MLGEEGDLVRAVELNFMDVSLAEVVSALAIVVASERGWTIMFDIR